MSTPQRNLKTPKGTKDFTPEQSAIREELVFDPIKAVFKKHGAVTIDTPAMELKETLMGKYGEDSKLIYDLLDQGGELCSLRYDLTVPFARYLAMHGIKSMRRYHIAKVYRRDNPVMTKGRFREFYQCDFDIAGRYDVMVPDAECLKIMDEILVKLGVGQFKIRLSHRKLLDGMFTICGVPNDKIRPVSSAVDKLDKELWTVVREEIIQKGVDPSVTDKIGEFVLIKGNPVEQVNSLLHSGTFKKSEAATTALGELKTLFDYLEIYGALKNIEFDMSLARGLDYYTGIIYEAVVVDPAGEGVGTVAAGGRYDDLVGIFGGEQIPAVGISIGVERIFSILEAKKQNVKSSQTLVLVASKDGQRGLLKDRMNITNMLWSNNIPTEMIPKTDPKLRSQLNYANNNQIPLVLILDAADISTGKVALKDLEKKTQIDLTINRLIPEILPHLQPYLSPPIQWGPPSVSTL